MLYDELKVPIGLIESDWSNTRIEPWSSGRVFEQCNVKPSIHELSNQKEYFETVNGKVTICKRTWQAFITTFSGFRLQRYMEWNGASIPQVDDIWSSVVPRLSELTFLREESNIE